MDSNSCWISLLLLYLICITSWASLCVFCFLFGLFCFFYISFFFYILLIAIRLFNLRLKRNHQQSLAIFQLFLFRVAYHLEKLIQILWYLLGVTSPHHKFIHRIAPNASRYWSINLLYIFSLNYYLVLTWLKNDSCSSL